MKMLIGVAAAVAVLATPVAAETRYDRKLEQAVMDIVAKKMGEIRGGFSYDEKPIFVVVQDKMTTGSIAVEKTVRLAAPAAPPDGLTRAVERNVTF
jgi:orotate phosphoribosyltransferase